MASARMTAMRVGCGTRDAAEVNALPGRELVPASDEAREDVRPMQERKKGRDLGKE